MASSQTLKDPEFSQERRRRARHSIYYYSGGITRYRINELSRISTSEKPVQLNIQASVSKKVARRSAITIFLPRGDRTDCRP